MVEWLPFWASPEGHNRGIMPTYPSICRTICKTVAKQTNKPTKVWQLPSGSGSGFGPAWESRSTILHLNLNPNPSLNLGRQYNKALDMCTHGRYRRGERAGQTTIVITHLLCPSVCPRKPLENISSLSSVNKKKKTKKKKERKYKFLAVLWLDWQMRNNWDSNGRKWKADEGSSGHLHIACRFSKTPSQTPFRPFRSIRFLWGPKVAEWQSVVWKLVQKFH